MPRILSPAYFHHYNAQPPVPPGTETNNVSTSKLEESADRTKEMEGERLVIGLGPVQTSFWRLSRLVPLDSVRRQLNKYRGNKVGSVETFPTSDSGATSLVEDEEVEAQSLEIQEGSDGISLKPISDAGKEQPDLATSGKFERKSSTKSGDGRKWGRMPYLPSYVPFGEVCRTKLIPTCFCSLILKDACITH